MPYSATQIKMKGAVWLLSHRDVRDHEIDQKPVLLPTLAQQDEVEEHECQKLRVGHTRNLISNVVANHHLLEVESFQQIVVLVKST